MPKVEQLSWDKLTPDTKEFKKYYGANELLMFKRVQYKKTTEKDNAKSGAWLKQHSNKLGVKKAEKSKRKEWWANLPEKERVKRLRKYETKGKKTKIVLPELTQTDIKRINDNMRRIGMEKYIVLYEEGEILY